MLLYAFTYFAPLLVRLLRVRLMMALPLALLLEPQQLPKKWKAAVQRSAFSSAAAQFCEIPLVEQAQAVPNSRSGRPY